jgi:hypothetical protein
VPVLRVSFGRVLRIATAIWVSIDLGAGILSEAQIAEIIDRGYARMRHYVTLPQRSRSFPRAVRQPVTGWPRLMKNESIEAPLEFTVV